MSIDGFHLLRPDALWLLLPTLPASLLLWRVAQHAGGWRRAIDPALLPHVLIDQQSGRRSGGHWLVSFALCLAVLAIAGPSVRKVDVPVFQRADALVVVLDLSASMNAADTQPSRVRRARQKIRDLLAERSEGVTGLVVYAGDAHVVAPLTDDRRTIENLLPALEPAIMPIPGSNATKALEEAAKLLGAAGVASGQILLITDDMPRFDPEDVRPTLESANAKLSILGVGTRAGAPIPRADGGFIRDAEGNIVVPGLPAAELESVAAQLGGQYATVALDNSDIERLLRVSAFTDSGEIQLDRKTDTWLDQGNWIALLLALGCLPLFRRGMLALLIAAPLLISEPVSAQLGGADLWQTRDQQAAELLKKGEAAEAAALFEDPAWRGTAHYQAEEWLKAADSFGRGSSASSYYNQGNALAKAGEFKRAIEAYDKALELEPDAADALRNKDLVQQLLQQQESQQSKQGDDGDQSDQEDQQSEDQQGSTAGSQGSNSENQSENDSDSASPQDRDDTDADSAEQTEGGSEGEGESDAKGSNQTGGQSAVEGSSQGSDEMSEAMDKELEAQTQAQMSKFDEALEEQQALEQWLRRVPDDPGGLLRRKFRYESIQRLRKGEEPDDEIRW